MNPPRQPPPQYPRKPVPDAQKTDLERMSKPGTVKVGLAHGNTTKQG